MKSSSYMTRALRARDPRFATILGKLGYQRADVVPAPTVVDIPDNWRDLSWPELRSLAAKVSDSAISNKVDAVAAIELELESRN